MNRKFLASQGNTKIPERERAFLEGCDMLDDLFFMFCQTSKINYSFSQINFEVSGPRETFKGLHHELYRFWIPYSKQQKIISKVEVHDHQLLTFHMEVKIIILFHFM